MGVDEFGEFASLLAVVTIISKIIDFGLGPILFRELSSENTKLGIIDNVISLKLVLTVLVFMLYNISVFLIGISPNKILLSDILFLNIIFSSRMANFREILSTPFKATLQMHIPMLINILDSSLLLIYVIISALNSLTLEKFVFGYVFFNIPGFVVLIFSLRKKFDYKFHFSITKLKWIIKEALPLAGFVLLMIIFQQADILLLKSINGTYFTGIYSASTRLTMPLNIIPATIVTSVFPLIVKHRGESEFSEKIILIFKVLFFISFLFAIIFTFKTHSFIKITFGEMYSDSAIPTLLLFWAQVFLFFSFLGSDILTAYNSQRWNFIYAVLIVFVNLLLDLILLPEYNYIGAGISKLVSSFLGALLIAYILKTRKVNFFTINIKTLLWMLSTIGLMYLLSFFGLYLYILFVIILIFITLRYHLFFSFNEVLYFKKIFRLQNWVFQVFYDKNKFKD